MNAETSPQSPLRFVFNWRITLLALLALPLLISLGLWQLARAEEKRVLEAGYAEQQRSAPIILNRDNRTQLPLYQRVIVHGQIDNDHTWLLDNKQRRGRVGYEVVSPVQLDDGSWLLVNRGWIAATETRASLPEVLPLAGEQTLFGEWVQMVEHPLLDAASSDNGWPRVILALEADAMSEQLGQQLPVQYLRLDDQSPGAFETGWQAVTMSSQKHMGYAFQWFGLAVALMIWFVFANSNLLAWWRGRNSSVNPEFFRE